MKKTKKTVILALMVSQALILSIIETWIPVPVILPGVKLGLANIVTIVAIVFFGLKEAMMILVARTLLSSLFGGGLVIFLFSIVGGIFSTFVMWVMYKYLARVFSLVGISVAGAIMHNVGQLFMASIVLKETAVFGYLPVLLVSGVIMGLFVGLVGTLLVKALRASGIISKI